MGDFFDEHVYDVSRHTHSFITDPSPYIIDPLSSRVDITRFSSPSLEVTYTGSDGSSVMYRREPYSGLIPTSYEEVLKATGREEELKVDIHSKEANRNHIVYCENEKDLSSGNILLTLSAMKGRLMYDIMPIAIQGLECKMTPAVKQQLIEASKRLRRYGKKSPIIPRFDEYGKRLPDEIEIGDHRGIQISIVDPAYKGNLHLELIAKEFDLVEDTHNQSWSTYGYGDDVPF